MPAVSPVSRPVLKLIAATDGLPLVQVPPPEASVKVVVVPGQMTSVPAMAAGTASTVMTEVMRQPSGNV